MDHPADSRPTSSSRGEPLSHVGASAAGRRFAKRARAALPWMVIGGLIIVWVIELAMTAARVGAAQ